MRWSCSCLVGVDRARKAAREIAEGGRGRIKDVGRGLAVGGGLTGGVDRG